MPCVRGLPGRFAMSDLTDQNVAAERHDMPAGASDDVSGKNKGFPNLQFASVTMQHGLAEPQQLRPWQLLKCLVRLGSDIRAGLL